MEKTFDLTTTAIFENLNVCQDIQITIYRFLHFQSNAIDATHTLIIKYFILYCYGEIKIDHVVYNGLKYYQRTNDYYRCSVDRPIHDPDIICSGSHDYFTGICHYTGDIIPIDDQNIDYALTYSNKICRQYSYSGDRVLESDGKFDYSEDHGECMKLLNNIKTIGMENITLENITSVEIHNPYGRNSDHRGADHCKIKLEVHTTYYLSCPITLEDLFNALFRMKSHKWDTTYERFSGCNARTFHGVLRIDLEFSYGQ